MFVKWTIFCPLVKGVYFFSCGGQGFRFGCGHSEMLLQVDASFKEKVGGNVTAS